MTQLIIKNPFYFIWNFIPSILYGSLALGADTSVDREKKGLNVTGLTKLNQISFPQSYSSVCRLVSTVLTASPGHRERWERQVPGNCLQQIIPIWLLSIDKCFISKKIQVFLCPISIILFGIDFPSLIIIKLWGGGKSWVWHLLLLFYLQLLSHRRKLDYSDIILSWQIHVDCN